MMQSRGTERYALQDWRERIVMRHSHRAFRHSDHASSLFPDVHSYPQPEGISTGGFMYPYPKHAPSFHSPPPSSSPPYSYLPPSPSA